MSSYAFFDQVGGARPRGSRNIGKKAAYDPISNDKKDTFVAFVKNIEGVTNNKKTLESIRKELWHMDKSSIKKQDYDLLKSRERDMDRQTKQKDDLDDEEMQKMMALQDNLPKLSGAKSISSTLLGLLQKWAPTLYKAPLSQTPPHKINFSTPAAFMTYATYWLKNATDDMVPKKGTVLRLMKSKRIATRLVKLLDILFPRITTKASNLTELRKALERRESNDLNAAISPFFSLSDTEKKIKERRQNTSKAAKNRYQTRIAYSRIVEIFEAKSKEYQSKGADANLFDRIMLAQLMTGSRLTEVLTLTTFDELSETAYKSAKSLNLGERSIAAVECKQQAEDEGDYDSEAEEEKLSLERKAMARQEFISIGRLAKSMSRKHKQALLAAKSRPDEDVWFNDSRRVVPIWVPHQFANDDSDRFWYAKQIKQLIDEIRDELETSYGIDKNKKPGKEWRFDSAWRKRVKSLFNYGPYNNYVRHLWGWHRNMKSHQMRALYGNLTYEAYAPERRSLQFWLSQVLGHRGDDMAAASYYSNISINYGTKAYSEPRYWQQLKTLKMKMRKIERGGVPTEPIQAAPEAKKDNSVFITYGKSEDGKPLQIKLQKRTRSTNTDIATVYSQIHDRLRKKNLSKTEIDRLLTWRLYKRLGFGSNKIASFKKRRKT